MYILFACTKENKRSLAFLYYSNTLNITIYFKLLFLALSNQLMNTILIYQRFVSQVLNCNIADT